MSLKRSLRFGLIVAEVALTSLLLVGAVVHGQPADVVAELEAVIRERPVVDDLTRLADDSLRPADAVAV